jgi:HEAT repeat protein
MLELKVSLDSLDHSACSELGLIVWNAGIAVQNHIINDSHAIELLFNILKDEKESSNLKVQVLMTISLLVRGSKAICLHLLDFCNLVPFLVTFINDSDTSIAKWAIHVILFALIDNDDRFINQLENLDVKVKKDTPFILFRMD